MAIRMIRPRMEARAPICKIEILALVQRGARRAVLANFAQTTQGEFFCSSGSGYSSRYGINLVSGQSFFRVKLFFISFWVRDREGVAASSRIRHSPELSQFFVESFKQWIPYRFTWFNLLAPFGMHLSLATTYSKLVAWFRPKTFEKNLAQPAAVIYFEIPIPVRGLDILNSAEVPRAIVTRQCWLIVMVVGSIYSWASGNASWKSASVIVVSASLL